jgi:3-dehydroquinate synthase
MSTTPKVSKTMNTRTLEVRLGERSYPIVVGPNLLGSADLLLPHVAKRRVALISNETVFPLYGRKLAASLREAGVALTEIQLSDGEQYKTLASLERVYDALLREAFDRKSVIVALGGGVVGDLAGFAAATYQRGIPFIQVPTTLLAQVDSSVGGKTAVNHPLGKNMIGAFHQPKIVLADTSVLATLPDRELRAGLAEVIKYGLIRDPAFLAWLEENMPALLARDPAALTHAIFESCRNKAEVVEADEHEQGERALLNLGHTFGHAIEGALGFGKWLHGEAVGAGMVLAARLSQQLGLISKEDLARTERIIAAAGLPVDMPGIPADQMLSFMEHDKKNEDGAIRLVLMKEVGRAYLDGSTSRGRLTEFLKQQTASR